MHLIAALLGFMVGISGALVFTEQQPEQNITTNPLLNGTVRRLQGTIVAHDQSARTLVVAIDENDAWNVPGKSRITYNESTAWRSIAEETTPQGTRVSYEPFSFSDLTAGTRIRTTLIEDAYSTLTANEIVIE